jgi:tetratricopeptide (TPR) repeat protein
LFILDGLERVLVAYHRVDAAEVLDEEANRPTDRIVNRNPCDAIRDEDNDLLRALATAVPSKILVSSRLTPRVLLNAAGLPIPGVRPIVLPGLEESDAEKLFRLCGITGDSAAIRSYLKANCDNHPLVIGVLAGLINDYLPDCGNFDAWSVDPDGGVQLNLASLDLIQRRNDILRAALAALSKESAQLLSTLALLSESVDYETLKAFNPHLPPELEKVEKPETPEQHWRWEQMTDEEKAESRKNYEAALTRWKDYEKAVKARLESPEFREAPKKLEGTVRDLVRRGLLQYDRRIRRHDLHPVVRGVAAGGMKAEDKERFGQRVVDHFSTQPHNPYEKAGMLEDLRSGLNVVRTLLKLGRFQEAARAYRGDLSLALRVHLEAHMENLALLRPFFPSGWGELPKGLDELAACDLANEAALVLGYCGEFEAALAAYDAILPLDLERKDWTNANLMLRNISRFLGDSTPGMLAKVLRVDSIAIELAGVRDARQDLFMGRLRQFHHQSQAGQWKTAQETWMLLDPMGRDWSHRSYRQGDAEWYFALARYWQGALQEEHLTAATSLAERDNNRTTLRDLQRLRGRWQLEQHDWQRAIASFQEALRMARERRLLDAESETGLALAKLHFGQLTVDFASMEAERLAQLRQPSHRYLAMLWQAIGDHAQGEKHALAAYKWAWADGEPYVNRYELTKTTELLKQLNVPIPDLPPYDPAKDEPFPWEADVRAAIEKLRAEKEAEKTNQN